VATSRRLALWLLFLTGLPASAEWYDLELHRLGNPDPASVNYQPTANASFRSVARELGMALNSQNLMPPETLGHSGFSVNAEFSWVVLPTDSQVPTEKTIEGALLIPSVHIRKGLPFSTEMGARIAWIERSRMFAATGEVKYALNEGFKYIPDLGIRLHLSRLLNARELNLTTAGADLGLGKQFSIGGMVTLTPYVGWNLVWVSAKSGQIDFRPERTQEEALASTTSQLNETNVFEELAWAENMQNRFYGGLRFIGGIVQLGAEFSASNLAQFKSGDATVAPSQVQAWNFTLGLDF